MERDWIGEYANGVGGDPTLTLNALHHLGRMVGPEAERVKHIIVATATAAAIDELRRMLEWMREMGGYGYVVVSVEGRIRELERLLDSFSGPGPWPTPQPTR